MKNTFTVLFLFSCFSVFSQDGVVDPNFGSNGYAVTSIANGINRDIQKITVLANGKILQCFSVISGANTDFGLARYDSLGNLDPAFGSGAGYVITNFGGTDVATSLAVQSNGKIVVSGYSTVAGNSSFAVARYDSLGNLDPTFNGTGKVLTHIGTGTDDLSYSSFLQKNGKIVVAGNSNNGTKIQFALVRFDTSGNKDATFGTNGIVTTSINNIVDNIFSVVVQNNGKILTAGYSYYNASQYEFALTRYDSLGNLDNTFNGNGIKTTLINAASGNDYAHSVAVQNNGFIVAGGASYNGTTFDYALVRYDSLGTLDNTFGTGGIVTQSISGGDDIIYSVGIQQTDSKILAMGTTTTGPSNNDFSIARFMTSGALDNSFGPSNNGINIIDFGADDFGFTFAPQGNRIILGGTSGTSLALTRLTNSRSFYVVSSGFSVVPVLLTSFSAIRENNSVLLKWQTATEQMSSFFDIQRSPDGMNFTSIGKVNANGNTNALINYSFTDNKPYSSYNYYRLRSVDIDGKSMFSKVLSIKFEVQDFTIQFYPNPAHDALNIQLMAPSEKIRLQILNISGRVIKNIDLNGNGGILSTVIDISNLARGIYFIRINGSIEKIVKQ